MAQRKRRATRPRKRRTVPTRADLSIGDILLAMRRLRPKDVHTIREMAKMLGLQRLPPVAQTAGAWQSSLGAEASTTPATTTAPPTPAAASHGSTIALPQLTGTRVIADRIGRVTFSVAEAAASDGQFQPADGRSESEAPPPLFARRTARALLSTAIATQHEGTELDVERATVLLATKLRLDRIPYRQVATLRRGVQVLIDRTAAMNPFHHDVEYVVEDLARLFGRDQMEIGYFHDCPSRGLSFDHDPERDWWLPPARRAPVVILSDFGLTRIARVDRSSVFEWLRFASDVRAAGCSLIGLVPLGPERWPPALAARVTFVHWSERTTARQIARARRESHLRLGGPR